MASLPRPAALRTALAATLVLSLSLTACKKKDDVAEKAASTPALAVTTTPVVTRQMADALDVSGPVSAVEEMQLGVELSGLRVTALHVDVGQPVRRGQVLLTLDHRVLDSSLAQANAAMREAEAGAELARANLNRGQGLASSKYISATQLDELRAARTQAEARLGTARAARDAAALQRSFADLRAPANGILSKRLVQPGQVVSAGMELMRMIRDGKLEWRAELPSAQLSQVKPGDRIALHTREGKPIEGRVRAVSPGVDATTRTGTVYADLPQPGDLQPGVYLQGSISTGLSDALVIPTQAIVLRDGFPTVFTIDAQGVAHQARVRTGGKESNLTAVIEGVKAGDQVALQGAGFLADGDKVRVVSAGAQPAAATTPTANTP